MKLLVTGAAGHMAGLALPGLAGRHALRLADRRAPATAPPGAEFREIDLLGAPDETLRALFAGVETVVHCAYLASAKGDVYAPEPAQIERFDAELDNIRMAQRVYRCALEAGARRVVMTSSNHATDWFEHTHVHARRRDMIYPHDAPLADNFYGWSKASYELLGYPYACGTFGRRLEVVHLRIGSPYPVRPARYEPGAAPETSELPRQRGAAGFKRALGAYLSPRDAAQLYRRAVEAPRLVAEGEVPWLVVYGVSNNTRGFWSLESARAALDYQPEDDSELIWADDIRRLLGDSPGRLGA